MDQLIEERSGQEVQVYKKHVRVALRNVVRLTMKREKSRTRDEELAKVHRHGTRTAFVAYVAAYNKDDTTLTAAQRKKSRRRWCTDRLQMFHKLHQLDKVASLRNVFFGQHSKTVGYGSHGEPGVKTTSNHSVSDAVYVWVDTYLMDSIIDHVK
jgi:hypothetical protein